jgi:hypothetical protein
MLAWQAHGLVRMLPLQAQTADAQRQLAEARHSEQAAARAAEAAQQQLGEQQRRAAADLAEARQEGEQRLREQRQQAEAQLQAAKAAGEQADRERAAALDQLAYLKLQLQHALKVSGAGGQLGLPGWGRAGWQLQRRRVVGRVASRVAAVGGLAGRAWLVLYLMLQESDDEAYKLQQQLESARAGAAELTASLQAAAARQASTLIRSLSWPLSWLVPLTALAPRVAPGSCLHAAAYGEPCVQCVCRLPCVCQPRDAGMLCRPNRTS